MGISEKKMKIVIDNYFHSECNVNTSIRSAFEKGFRIGVEKGLSAQPEQQSFSCGQENDPISRQAAIAVADYTDYTGLAIEDVKKITDEVVKGLKQLPSVQPEQRWIPVTERLPIARRSVIISTKNWTGEGCYWETTEHHVIWKGYRWNATYWDDEVTAWMPLPEPYREGDEAK